MFNSKLPPDPITKTIITFINLYTSYTSNFKVFTTIFRVFKYAKNEWPSILATNIFMLISSTAIIHIPKYQGKLIDTVTNSKQFDDLLEVVIHIILLKLTHQTLYFIRILLNGRINRTVAHNMTCDFFEKILHKDIEYFDKTKVGELTSRLNQDVQQAQGVST